MRAAGRRATPLPMSKPPFHVRVRGDGIAAHGGVRLLRAAGLAVGFDRVARPPVPVLMLSDQALALMCDVFASPAVFADLPRIDRRVVAWGPDADPVAVDHGAVVLSETQLIAGLAVQEDAAPDPAPDFTIHTASPMPTGERHRFGDRRAVAVRVALTDPADRSTCWVEALPGGWLFLLPGAAGVDWLLAVGAPPVELLADSRLIAGRVELLDSGSAAFDTCPRIHWPLTGPDWIGCGTAALGFDPICGDGTAQAVREAILATAVVAGIARGEAAAPLLAHYEAVMLAGLRRHLMLSAQFYRSGGTGGWWRDQLAALAAGERWCADRLAGTPPPRFRLVDFDLVPIGDAA